MAALLTLPGLLYVALVVLMIGAFACSGLPGRETYLDSDVLAKEPAVLRQYADVDLKLARDVDLEEFAGGDMLRPFSDRGVMEDMNRRHRLFWRESAARRVMRMTPLVIPRAQPSASLRRSRGREIIRGVVWIHSYTVFPLSLRLACTQYSKVRL